MIPNRAIHCQVAHFVAKSINVERPATSRSSQIFFCAERKRESVLTIIEQADFA